jgi:hypothetical protein
MESKEVKFIEVEKVTRDWKGVERERGNFSLSSYKLINHIGLRTLLQYDLIFNSSAITLFPYKVTF